MSLANVDPAKLLVALCVLAVLITPVVGAVLFIVLRRRGD